MLDILIQNRTAVTPEQVTNLDMGIRNGQIAVVSSPSKLEVEASVTRNATGIDFPSYVPTVYSSKGSEE